VRFLVEIRKSRQSARRRIGVIFGRFMPVKQLPGTGYREEDKDGREQTTKIKMQCSQEFHALNIALLRDRSAVSETNNGLSFRFSVAPPARERVRSSFSEGGSASSFLACRAVVA
jgi:hypothetical protein